MQALILKRADVRESSRLVTLISRERGKFTALAKGAHRPNSACLGRLDLLNRIEVSISGRGMALIGRVRLLHEPRRLREPARFLIASHICELIDTAFVPERADPELFDLTVGAVTLIERAPSQRLPVVLAGLEARFLTALGLLGALDRCGACGAVPGPDGTLWASSRHGDLRCDQHREPGARPVRPEVLDWLEEIVRLPGRELPTRNPSPVTAGALALLGAWLEHALEFRPRLRRLALDASAARSTPPPRSSSIRR